MFNQFCFDPVDGPRHYASICNLVFEVGELEGRAEADPGMSLNGFREQELLDDLGEFRQAPLVHRIPS